MFIINIQVKHYLHKREISLMLGGGFVKHKGNVCEHSVYIVYSSRFLHESLFYIPFNTCQQNSLSKNDQRYTLINLLFFLDAS